MGSKVYFEEPSDLKRSIRGILAYLQSGWRYVDLGFRANLIDQAMGLVRQQGTYLDLLIKACTEIFVRFVRRCNTFRVPQSRV